MDDEPRSYYGGPDEKWVCVYPGKMGITWKLSADNHLSEEEARLQASKNCNVIAVPLAFWLRFKEFEQRMMSAEKELGLSCESHRIS